MNKSNKLYQNLSKQSKNTKNGNYWPNSFPKRIYFNLRRRVLQIENEQTDAGLERFGMGNLGNVVWDLALSNLAAWLLVFFCLFKAEFKLSIFV